MPSVVANCVYFEDCSEQYGEPCFTFYNYCVPGLPYGDLPDMLLGGRDPNQAYYYRIGYCPAAVDGDFVKAITMLSPGMKGQSSNLAVTPELAVLRRARLSSEDPGAKAEPGGRES